ncbi:hypothetical protein HELRODRAFT_63644 [Helobdella robusta]|uniref:RNA ligase 1 n=1 Tax=Helobdella robusta TaxID=6412 RepID=T1FXI6_HELRO|nr:hypothetical protein HELRODRAFT_63644 [Helobdella robusta]ESO13049.1 hypothetical protein HELRODRAFT_63644 [Helobdella robusta]
MLLNVKKKINCIFEIVIEPSISSKRPNQFFSVQATDGLRNEFVSSLNQPHIVSEKIDGTSSFVRRFNGIPWLWARHDRKPTKNYKKMHIGDSIDYQDFKIENYKDAPENWTASDACLNEMGKLIPDTNGHIMGWVPINPQLKQHCWHCQAVDLESGLALTLKPNDGHADNTLELSIEPLEKLEECTFELIGTNINGNAYNIGSKQAPLHILVRHGIIKISKTYPNVTQSSLRNWFINDENGRVEGIVWHCSNSRLYKLHRHHLGLEWPIDCTKLSTRPLVINIPKCHNSPNPHFKFLSIFDGRCFNSFNEFVLCYIDKYSSF